MVWGEAKGEKKGASNKGCGRGNGKSGGGNAVGGKGGPSAGPGYACGGGRQRQEVRPAYLKTWTDQQTKKLEASLAKMQVVCMKAMGSMSGEGKGLGGGVVAGKAGKWACGCGFDNFAHSSARPAGATSHMPARRHRSRLFHPLRAATPPGQQQR